MVKIYTSVILILLAVTASAQPFTSITNPFPGMGRGAVAFVDLDNDTDLDLIMSGQDNTFSPMGVVYVNTNGEFSQATTTIRSLYNSALSVADYDHDGLMDFIITGQDFSGNATRLYRNLGSMQFQLADSTLYAAGADGDVAFGDYDNDGYVDIVLSGSWNSKLYHNNTDGTFTEVPAGLPAMNSPSIAWGDYDNDGDLDLLMVGDDGSVTTYVLNNVDGVFISVNAVIEGAIGGSARWGDYDLDGLIDIMITGKDASLLPVSYLYHNDGDDVFSNSNAGLVGTALGPADWIDFDNDGDPDIMLSGQNAGCGNSSTILYINDGIGGYSQLQTLNFVERAASAWGDYDNDGDSDVLLTGISGTATRYFYRNDLVMGTYQDNTPPSVPQITDVFTWMDYVIVNWERSTDQQSPQAAISYNMRLGTTPGGIEILAPSSDVVTGLRYQPAQGNMGSNTFGIIRNLQPGTYYFSLQAIDQSFAASPFTEEQSFIILPTATNEVSTGNPLIQVTREGSNLTIHSDLPEARLVIFSLTGNEVRQSQISGGNCSVNMNGIPAGMYILKLVTQQGSYSRKIVY